MSLRQCFPAPIPLALAHHRLDWIKAQWTQERHPLRSPFSSAVMYPTQYWLVPRQPQTVDKIKPYALNRIHFEQRQKHVRPIQSYWRVGVDAAKQQTTAVAKSNDCEIAFFYEWIPAMWCYCYFSEIQRNEERCPLEWRHRLADLGLVITICETFVLPSVDPLLTHYTNP